MIVVREPRMMMQRPLVRLASVALILAACHTAPPATEPAPDTPQSLAGCYHVVVGPWTVTGAHMGLTPPSEFRLDTTRSPSQWDASRRGRAVTSISPLRDVRFSSWQATARDTIFVSWSNGFAGAGLRLAVRGDSVSGTARTFSDARTEFPDPTAPARGRRIDCPDSIR